jgi:sialate O-acetylesterase
MIRLIKALIYLAIYLIYNIVSANVSLPAIFSDHMVLQQNSEVKIWGWGNPLEEITITTSWNNESIKVKTDNQAHWISKIMTPKAGGPFEITIQGYNKIVIKDVLIGEVWLCSGQSNMEWSTNAGIENGKEEMKNANYPSIRFFSVTKNSAEYPQLDLPGEWKVCTPETMKYFSAIGYFFGQKIHTTLNIPVGLINSSWGGSPAEVWTPKEAFDKNEIITTAATKLKEEPWAPKQPSIVYNAMINPLIHFKIAGVLWYQGENNVQNDDTYRELLSSIIASWREKWEDNITFYIE